MTDIQAHAVPAFAPVHPGIMIRDMLNDVRLSNRTAATRIGVSAPALGNLLLGRSAISADMALRLGRLFGNAPEFWTRLQEGYDLWHRSRALHAELAKIERMALPAE